MAVYLGISNDGTFITSDDYALKDMYDIYLTALPESTKWKIVINNDIYRFNINLNLKEDE